MTNCSRSGTPASGACGRRYLALLPVLVLAACSVGPSQATTAGSTLGTTPNAPLVSLTPQPTNLLTAAPYAPGPAWEQFGKPIHVDPTVLKARTKVDGVVITMAVETSRISATHPTWVLTTLENVGNNVLHWVTDGCATHVYVGGATALSWTRGAAQAGPFKTFKDWLLDLAPGGSGFPIALKTTPEPFVGRGDYGCADVGVGHSLKPGRRIDARTLLEGIEPRGFGLVPSGPIELRATFGFWRRGSEDVDTTHHDDIVVTLPVELTDGRDPRLLSPGQAVDAALASPELQDALRRNPTIPAFSPTSLAFDLPTNTWHVGISVDRRGGDQPQTTFIVDGFDGRILEVRRSP